MKQVGWLVLAVSLALPALSQAREDYVPSQCAKKVWVAVDRELGHPCPSTMLKDETYPKTLVTLHFDDMDRAASEACTGEADDGWPMAAVTVKYSRDGKDCKVVKVENWGV